MNIVRKGHITPDEKRRTDYHYVPFDLPEPARRLHVRYWFSAAMSAAKAQGGNVIDVGIFDPRGMAFPGSAGFRGWSGSDRREFTITPTDATPGYIPGALPAGRYHVILGLYRIWPQGADYEVEVEAELGGPDAPPPALLDPPQLGQAPAPGEQPMLWLRGDLQSHSVHSDGKGTLAQLAGKARANGLDFLAVTDHNTNSHHPHLPALAGDDLLLIPGQESTSYYGHMNIWGTTRWCDFRCRSESEIKTVIELAHANGALCSINHPKTGGPPWEYDFDMPVDAMEVWQGPWPWHNVESLAAWAGLLKRGRRVTAVGGSDYHCPAGEDTNFLRLGQPTTWVKATARSAAAVLDAIRAGRVSISAMPAGPRLDLRAEAGHAVAGIGERLPLPSSGAAKVEVDVEGGAGFALRLVADGAIVHEEMVTEDRVTVRVAVTAGVYLRAELVGDAPPELVPDDIPPDIDLRGLRWALTNPVYIA